MYKEDRQSKENNDGLQKEYFLPRFLDTESLGPNSLFDNSELDLEGLNINEKMQHRDINCLSGPMSLNMGACRNCDLSKGRTIGSQDNFNIQSKPFYPRDNHRDDLTHPVKGKYSHEVSRNFKDPTIGFDDRMQSYNTSKFANALNFEENWVNPNIQPGYLSFNPVGNTSSQYQNPNLTQNQAYFNQFPYNYSTNTQSGQNKFNPFNTDHGGLGPRNNMKVFQFTNSNNNSFNNTNNTSIDSVGNNQVIIKERKVPVFGSEEISYPEFSLNDPQRKSNSEKIGFTINNQKKNQNLLSKYAMDNEKTEDMEVYEDIDQLISSLPMSLHEFIKTQRGSR